MKDSKEKFLRTCPQIIIPDELAPLKSFIDCLSDKVDIRRCMLHYNDCHYYHFKPSEQYNIYQNLMKWRDEYSDINRVHLFVVYKSDEDDAVKYKYDVVGIEFVDGVFTIDTEVDPKYKLSGDLYITVLEVGDAIRGTLRKNLPKGPLAMVNRHRRKRW